MNHRTHSGTVIANPNVFDKNPTKNQTSSASMAAPPKPATRSTLDFDALESIPFDDDGPVLISGKGHHSNQSMNFRSMEERSFSDNEKVVIEQILTTMSLPAAKASEFNGKMIVNSGDATMHTNSSNSSNSSGSHRNTKISAVFKKLTTYFSSSPHKTLINLKSNNSKNRHWDQNDFSNKNSSIDTCAVFENCNVVSLPIPTAGPVVAKSVHSTCSSSNSSSESTSECSIDIDSSPSNHSKHSCSNSCYQKSDKCCSKPPQQQPTKARKMVCGDKRDVEKCDEIVENNKTDKANKMATAPIPMPNGLQASSATAANANAPATRTKSKRQMDLNAVEASETFSLPRVSLKQSAAPSTGTENSHHRKNIANASQSNPNSGSSLDRRRRLSGCLYGDDAIKDTGRGEQNSSSHYSTEKSGSSGYYSSNIYSTSSVEDHIYSEPVIDVIDDSNRRRKFEQKLDQQIGLANLEKSIKTLEKHLKLLNKNNKKEHWHHQQQRNTLQRDHAVIRSEDQLSEASGDEKIKRLPTIVEGTDNNTAAVVAPYQRTDKDIQRQSGWAAEVADDSLHDIDLDTFLLINEVCDKNRNGKKANHLVLGQDGIENPIFESDHEPDAERLDNDVNDNDILRNETSEHIDDNLDEIPVSSSDKNIENNYKCTKYINSCPDDAYKVEEIIDYKYEQPHSPFASKSMSFYLKNIEDHIQHQNTKDILVEIRDKLMGLLKPATESEHESESDGIGSTKSDSKGDTLKQSITALKHDLDNYLLLMNQQNEMEIRAFCSGLSKNYKLLTIQHALGNRMRRSLVSTSDIGSELYSNRSFTDSSSGSQTISNYVDYHQSLLRRKRRAKNQIRKTYKWKNQMKNSQKRRAHVKAISGPLENESFRCSSGSDSNFQLQRRHSDSICSSWDEDQQVTLASSSGSGSRSGSSQDVQSDNSVGNDVIVPIEVQTLLSTQNEPSVMVVNQLAIQQSTGHIESNLAMQQPSLITTDDAKNTTNDEKDSMLEWHRKPSIWQQYYGSKRLKLKKKIKGKFDVNPSMNYPSTRPETDFTLDLPRAEQLRIKMQKEKKFRCRCRLLLAIFSLVFFLMTVVIFSLMLSRGKRMFGSMVTL